MTPNVRPPPLGGGGGCASTRRRGERHCLHAFALPPQSSRLRVLTAPPRGGAHAIWRANSLRAKANTDV